MPHEPRRLSDEALGFLTERHLATLTTIRRDAVVRIITFAGSQKVRNLERHPHGRAAVSQVDGGRWLTLEGPAVVTDDPARVAEAVRRYAERYRLPGERADRVAIEIEVDRVMGRA
jgi:hypothetical protein